MLIKISPMGEDACSDKEGSSGMDSDNNFDDLLGGLPSCDDLDVLDDEPWGSLDVPYTVGTEDLGGAFNSFSIKPSSQRNIERTDDVELKHASETKFADTICPSFPRRRCGTSVVNQKDQMRRTTRLCGRSPANTGLPDSMLMSVERKRRSHSCKQARSSVWGSLDHILPLFERHSNVANGLASSQKARGVRGSRKQTKKQASTSAASLKENSCLSSSRLRIKIKIGNQVGNTCTKDMVSGTDNGAGNCCLPTIEDSELDNSSDLMSKKNVPEISGFQFSTMKRDEMVKLSDSFQPNINLINKVSESTLVPKLSVADEMVPSQIEVTGTVVAAEKAYIDAGTSPDSEVINIIPEAQVNREVQEGNIVTSSAAVAVPADILCLDLLQTSSQEIKEKSNIDHENNFCVEDRRGCPEITSKGSLFERQEHDEKGRDVVYSSEASISTTPVMVHEDMPSSDSFLVETLPSSRIVSSAIIDSLRAENGIEEDQCTTPGLETDLHQPGISPRTKAEGRKHPKSSNPKGVRNQKEIDRKQKGKRGKSVTGRKVKDKGSVDGLLQSGESHAHAGDLRKVDSGRESTKKKSLNLETFARGVGQQYPPPRSAWVLCDDCSKWRRIDASLADSIGETDCRWTCQDNLDQAFADCSIPQEKSNAAINAELEISDASEGEDDGRAPSNSKKLESRYSTVPEQSSWKLIKSNLFLHRGRKSQSIDEVMVCHCKSPPSGRMGCGDGCLNRMLNIECVRGTCPCGERCSNQQFQKRDYAKLKWFRCGKKGYGLQSLETISEGQFLIEYVGEVLDMVAYEARQRDYALKGHKHFYFMTLNGSEVIDACAKGNLGRFINHSCDPNCRTEKWMVNGEVCIGLFALRKINKGEELTFDYNYVRVFGAAAKKCVCGSPQCRGYIGGDPSNTEVTVQGDSDEEFPEPVMFYEDGEVDENLRSIISTNISFDTEMPLSENTSDTSKMKLAEKSPELSVKEKPSLDVQTPEKLVEDEVAIHKLTVFQNLEIGEENHLSESESGAKLSLSLDKDNLLEKLPPSVQKVEALSDSVHGSSKTISNDQEFVSRSDTFLSPAISVKSLPDKDVTKHKGKVDRIGDKFAPKLRPHVKTSRSSSSVKEKLKSISVHGKSQAAVKKSHGVSHKTKKIDGCALHGRFEAVEVKLNELLDANGGISKRKDAARGYLKLLLLTAASGDSGNGEGIQSNRDLSMILDALLKTKSRMVLVDVINKNGLQMLHNIMKRYRRDFKKIPILRKLLKVLEYLAMREILTLEHITGGPLCPGVESFRESILTFTEHNDKQVHQIARNFRDKWIPRHARKISCIERIDAKGGSICNKPPSSLNNSQDDGVEGSEAPTSINQSSSATKPAIPSTPEGSSTSFISACPTSDIRPRKRKSRWDQPSEVDTDAISPPAKEPKMQPPLLEKSHMDPKPDISNMIPESRNDLTKGDNSPDVEQSMDEDVPPGFFPLSSPPVAPNVSVVPGVQEQNCATAECPSQVVIGHPHGRFMNQWPVCYGIPSPVVQQFGTLQAGTSENWVVAPGLPFCPFPPLPPYPRHAREGQPCAVNSVMSKPGENSGPSNPCPPFFRPNQNPPCTSGASPTVPGVQNANNQHRGNFGGVGRKRPFRQQNWNNSRSPPSWGQKRDNWGSSKGNDLRNRTGNTSVATVGNTSNSQGIGSGVGNGFQQYPQQQNHQ